jgi:hypothetical protein
VGAREGSATPLAGQFSEELLLIHPILKGFAAVYEHDRHLVSELASQAIIQVDVHLPPPEAAPPLKFRELFLDDLTEVASLTGVNNNFSRIGASLRAHGELRESSKPGARFPRES